MKFQVQIVASICLILFLCTSSVAHTGNDIINDENLDSYWTWHSSFTKHKRYSWDFITTQYGSTYKEGKIRISILQDLADINILSIAKEQPERELEDMFDNFFDIRYDENIAYFSSVYRIHYFFVPISLSFKNGTELHLFEDRVPRSYLFYGLVNDTIDNTCIQGCHTEDNNPFSTVSVQSFYEPKSYIIEGQFEVNKGNLSQFYSYDTGTFQAKYDKESGLLDHWLWISEDKMEKVEIIRKLTLQPMFYVVLGTTMIAGLLLIIIIFVKKIAIVQPVD